MNYRKTLLPSKLKKFQVIYRIKHQTNIKTLDAKLTKITHFNIIYLTLPYLPFRMVMTWFR